MIRTVSLLPAATEIVGALGLMDHLLAVSHECDYPEEANRRPRVTACEIHGKGLSSAAIDRWVSERLQAHGSLYTLDQEKLRELRPDLLLTQRLCDVCAPAFDSVEAAGFEPGTQESRGHSWLYHRGCGGHGSWRAGGPGMPATPRAD